MAPTNPPEASAADPQTKDAEVSAAAASGAMPSAYVSEFANFVRQLASATGDLSQLTCPAFLLNGISLLEYSQYWCDHPDLLWDIASPKHTSPEDRLLAVTRWFVSTLYGSYRVRYVETKSERKPYNPILGEQFFASCKDSKGTGWEEASIAVEQVSHHPPISAFFIQIPAKPVSGKPLITVQGHCGQQTAFATSTIKVVQVGRARITVHLPGAFSPLIYTIHPLPELQICGLLSATLFLELCGKSRITVSTGESAEIDFVPKGWFTGEYFQIRGTINSAPSNGTAKPVYTISGNWTAKTVVHPAGKKEAADAITLFDAETTKPEPRVVKPIIDLGETESHRVWGAVTEAIKASDYATASARKSEIEDRQRKIRRERKERNEAWCPSLFEFVVPPENAPEIEKQGTTARDPQQHQADGHGGKNEPRGHWIYKFQPSQPN